MPRFRLRRKNQEGTAAVEFALIAPVLALLLSGIIETSLIMYASAVMEGALTTSSRLGKTGYTQSGVSRETMIYDMIRSQCGVLIDTSQISITTESYSNFNNIGQPEPYTDSNHNSAYNTGEPYTDVNGNGHWDNDMGESGAGGAGDVVLYRVSYPWRILTPMMSYVFGGSSGIFTITSSVVVKNEPYDTE